jgi:hypothetical protein
MASFSLMLRAHTADTHPTAIFIHNGAPQALVGSQAGSRRFAHFPSPSRLGSAPSEIIPKASIERPGASKAFNPLHKISFLFSESRIINGLRATGGKKMPTAPWGRTWVARRRGERSSCARMRFALANAGDCVSRSRGLSSSILILACRRRIDVEAGVRAHPQLPVNVRDARSLREEHIVNDATVCQEKC